MPLAKPAPWNARTGLVALEYQWYLRAPVVLPLWRSSPSVTTPLVNLGRAKVDARIQANATPITSWVTTAGGAALRIPNPDSGNNVGEIEFGTPISIAAGKDFTCAVVLSPDYPSAPSNPGIWRSGAGGGGSTFIITHGATRDIWVRLNGTNILNPTATNRFPQGVRGVYTIVVRSGVDVQFWMNGALVSSATHAIATPAFTIEQIGWQASLNPVDQLGGDWETVIIDDRAWPKEMVKRWHADPFGPFRYDRPQRRYKSAAGPVVLTVADCSHGHTVDNVALTQANTLAVAEALHAHAVDNVALTQANTLVVADALHDHAVESPSLTQANVLAVADALHAHSVESPTLSLASLLELADAFHSHSVDSPPLTQANILAVAEALHAHLADAPILVQANVLAVADALHAHSVDNVLLAVLGAADPAKSQITDVRHRNEIGDVTHRTEVTDVRHRNEITEM